MEAFLLVETQDILGGISGGTQDFLAESETEEEGAAGLPETEQGLQANLLKQHP